MAVRASAARRDAARASRAVAQRVHDPPAAVRRRTRSITKVYSYVQGWSGTDYSKNIVVDEKDHPYTRHQLRVGPRAAASAARRTSGAGWRCGCPTTTSRRRATTATARTGRSPTRTSSRTTTASIGTSASPASRRTCRICPTACFSGRPGWRAAEVTLRELAQEDEPRADAVSRRRHDRRPEAQQVSQPLLRPRRVQPPRRAAATSTPRSTRRPA